jgi:hypothetical protein
MSAVVEFVGDVVGDVVEFVGDVGETVVQAAGDVVEVVSDVAQNVVQTAIDDPLGTIAKVGTAIYAPYLLPVVTAGHVIANGGDIEDALISGAVSYAVPQVGNFVGSQIAGSAVGDFLTEAAQATGIEALPQAVTRGLTTATGQTLAGVAQGQDFEDALAGGLTAGVGSTIGRIAGSEIDTGSRVADRLIGQTIAGGTTAALRDRDIETGAGKALASGLLDYGFNQGVKGITSLARETPTSTPTNVAEYDYSTEIPEPEAQAPQPLLASGATATDTSLTPTEELVGQMTGKVTVYDPATGLPVQTEGEKQYMQQFLEALYPDMAVENASGITGSEQPLESEAESIKNIDEMGNAYNDFGEVISSAFDLGLVKGSDAEGNSVWITNTGELIPASNQEGSEFTSQTIAPSEFATQIIAPSNNTIPDVNMFGMGESESAADYPQEIINNPDGSVTIIENDGTQRIFNVDGSVTLLGDNGEEIEEYAKLPEQTETETETEKEASSSTNTLGNIASTLLGGSTIGAMGGSSGGSRTIQSRGSRVPSTGIGGKMPSWVPGMTTIGAGIAAGINNATSGGLKINPFNYDQYGFNWNQQGVNPVQNSVAQGQQFLNPIYTKQVQAAEGGLMSIGNTVQPTLTNNGLSLDPSSSVQMYSKGGNVNNETMSIVKHLKAGGAPMHHIAGFLDYRQKKMAQGGHLGGYSDGGRMLKGPGDGMSDDIPASIAGVQPARLANEEFVIPADVVSHLGNGSSEAGAKVLYNMMDKVRKARTGHTKQGKQINPEKLMPKVRK